jgi:hypothetical protein
MNQFTAESQPGSIFFGVTYISHPTFTLVIHTFPVSVSTTSLIHSPAVLIVSNRSEHARTPASSQTTQHHILLPDLQQQKQRCELQACNPPATSRLRPNQAPLFLKSLVKDDKQDALGLRVDSYNRRHKREEGGRRSQ